MEIVEKDGRLNRYAAALIKHKARALVGHYGLTESDREDVEAELWADLIARQGRFDPERAKETTFIARVVNHRVASIIERRGAGKRDWRTHVCSLDEEVDCGDEEGLLRHEVVTKDTYLRTTRESVEIEADHQDRHLDVHRAIQSLPPELQEIAELLCEMNVSDAARVTGIPRTTINDKLKAIRRVFQEQGVDEWLG